MKRYLIYVLFGLLFSAQALSKDLSIVADSWAPMTDATLIESGFSIHFAKIMLKELGYTPSVKFQTWKRIRKDMGTTKYDMVAAVWHDKDREALMHFTIPYEINRLVFVSRLNQKFNYLGPESLKGKSLGLISSYAYPDEILNAKGVNLQYVVEAKQNILKLARGRIDMTIGDYLVMKYEAGRSLTVNQNLYYDLKHPIAEIPLYMAVSRQHPDHEKIVAGLNRLIRQYKSDGTYSNLQLQHGLE